MSSVLFHFHLQIYIFFNASVEFIASYSTFSEVYTNIFSFLIALCVISILDKYIRSMLKKEKKFWVSQNFILDNISDFRFDVARLDMDHLREIYMDHAKTAIAVPLYLITFSLHQASLKIDDQLALIHYRDMNETTWPNVSISWFN